MPREGVVDTNTFRRQDFLDWLRERMGRKYIPAVVYAELARYALMKGEGLPDLHDFLVNTVGLTVERMDHNHSALAAQLAHNDGPDKGWHGRARDYFIAAHVANSGRILVTENLKDFKCLGGAAVSVGRAMKLL